MMERMVAYLNSICPLSEKLVEELVEAVKYRELARSDLLLKAGHICRDIYFIEQGMLRCYYQKGDLDVCSWFMKDSDIIVSVESFYEQKPSYEWIQALEDCKLFYISYAQFESFTLQYHEFAVIRARLTAHYHILWTQLLHAIKMKTAEEKYTWLLERFPDYILRIPAKYLSSWLGITEQHFSFVKAKAKVK